MRVLLVTPSLPYPGVRHGGGRLLDFLVSRLSERHELTLVSRCFRGEEREIEPLRARVVRLETVATEQPWLDGRATSAVRAALSHRRLCRVAERLARSGGFDLVQVESSDTATFWQPVPGLPAFVTCQDLAAKPALRRLEAARGAARIAAALRFWLRRAAEARGLARFDGVFVLSENDAGFARRFYPSLAPTVLRYPARLGMRGLARRERPELVLYVGALGRPENVEAVRFLVSEVWPRVRARRPDAQLEVAGAGAGEVLRATLAGAEGASLRGEVEDLEALYGEASVVVAPVLTGGGIIVKVLEALAAGAPLVTTSRGNEGVAAVPGEHLLVADGAGSFASAVDRLLGDAALRARLGASGRQFVLQAFPDDEVIATLEQEWVRAVERVRRQSAP